MRIPVMRGVIDRRILVNFRIDPDVMSRILPAPFRPQLVDGWAIAGICLIRLRHVRPRFLPAAFGMGSENAAHRVAVVWDEAGDTRHGVYIPRRDTSSRVNAFVGGRLFPGVHHRAVFSSEETESTFRILMRSLDGSASLAVDAAVADALPDDSVFHTVECASRFFQSGSLGFSPDHSGNRFDGLELRTLSWHVQPLAVSKVQSSFFDDSEAFPSGSVRFDNALLMRGIDHSWHSRASICCTDKVVVPTGEPELSG